jgi:hypothetical protein
MLASLAGLACVSLLLALPAPAQLVFAPPLPSYAGNRVTQAVTGDLDGDGWPDVVTGHGGNGGPPRVSLGLGNGLFGNATPLSVPNSTRICPLADLDGDGRLDLALYNAPPLSSNPAPIMIALGKGDGSFGLPVTVALVADDDVPLPPGAMIRAGDVDGDGLDDLVYTTLANTPTLLSQGDGSLLVADCGACELVSCARVQLAGPGGVFGASQAYSLEHVPLAVAVGDVEATAGPTSWSAARGPTPFPKRSPPWATCSSCAATLTAASSCRRWS